jgi:hypothetical protein
MSKVTIDEALLRGAGISLLVERMRCTEATAVGALAVLWLKSRAAGITRAARSQIFPLLAVAPRHRDALFGAMVDAGFIRRLEDDLYCIAANEQYDALIEKRRRAGSLGRAKTALVATQRIAARQAAAAKRAAAKAKPVAKPKLKAKTALAKIPKKAASQAPTDSQEANRIAWASYREAFLLRWLVEPTRNAKVNACVATFVQRIGRAEAPDVLHFFVGHNAPDYIRATHSLTLAVRDAEALHVQWRRGQQILPNDLRQAGKANAVADQLRRIAGGEL